MKKIIYTTIILIVLVTILSCFIGCKGKDIEVSDDLASNKGDIVNDLSAYTLASTAYNNWKNNVFPNHLRTEHFTFSVNEGKMATRQARQIYKVDNGNIWSEQVTINSGLAGANYAVKLLYNASTETGYAHVLKGNKKVLGEEPDIYAISDWGTPDTYTMQENSEEIEKFKTDYKKMITTYNLDSFEYLDDTHDDTVYTYAPDPTKYLCTVTIDMSLEAQKTVQKIAKAEFENALGAKEDSIDMEPVTITFLVEKVDDTYRVLQWVSREVYTGYKLGTQSCAQSYKATFSYNEEYYKIEM